MDHPAGRHSIWTNQRPISFIPRFLRRMLFLLQPSHFILAWNRHQICWLAYSVAWFTKKLNKIRTKSKLTYEQTFSKLSKFNLHFIKLLQLLGDFGAKPLGALSRQAPIVETKEHHKLYCGTTHQTSSVLSGGRRCRLICRPPPDYNASV